MQPTTLLRAQAVMARTGLSQSGMYRKMAEGSFPSSIKIGERATAWIESEVQDWISERIQDDRGDAA